MVRNIQLKHSGKYVCMVHTEVDTVSAAADLIVKGMPFIFFFCLFCLCVCLFFSAVSCVLKLEMSQQDHCIAS